MSTKKIEIIVESVNDVYPDEINKDLDFYYIRMNSRHQVNQTKWAVINCDIKDV